ncbi:high mobility group B protein 7 isoform X2 [Alnus glutinosa]|uniref:high mobility group B protein 7 isoform X2 n=1 Tax=Alnus glutinosa TaxID=3517 RepID=UPI002D785C3F|nr:high mobility group B protein 7 isoform X2 [Alnus glutinosa]
MANPPRTRKRVLAVLRASDGSAYQKCNNCGVSVAVALADMHECETKEEVVVKRFRGVCGRQSVVKQSFGDQPRSPFRFFICGSAVQHKRESFVKTCETRNSISIDRDGVDTWKNLSKEERKPYISEAERVNSSYFKALLEEINNMQKVDDEADSATVGKFDQFYEGYEDSEESEDYDNSYSFDSIQYGETESLDTYVPY